MCHLVTRCLPSTEGQGSTGLLLGTMGLKEADPAPATVPLASVTLKTGPESLFLCTLPVPARSESLFTP